MTREDGARLVADVRGRWAVLVANGDRELAAEFVRACEFVVRRVEDAMREEARRACDPRAVFTEADAVQVEALEAVAGAVDELRALAVDVLEHGPQQGVQ